MIISVAPLPVHRRRRLGDISFDPTTLKYVAFAIGAWWLWSAFKKGRG